MYWTNAVADVRLLNNPLKFLIQRGDQLRAAMAKAAGAVNVKARVQNLTTDGVCAKPVTERLDILWNSHGSDTKVLNASNPWKENSPFHDPETVGVNMRLHTDHGESFSEFLQEDDQGSDSANSRDELLTATGSQECFREGHDAKELAEDMLIQELFFDRDPYQVEIKIQGTQTETETSRSLLCASGDSSHTDASCFVACSQAMVSATSSSSPKMDVAGAPQHTVNVKLNSSFEGLRSCYLSTHHGHKTQLSKKDAPYLEVCGSSSIQITGWLYRLLSIKLRRATQMGSLNLMWHLLTAWTFNAARTVAFIMNCALDESVFHQCFNRQTV